RSPAPPVRAPAPPPAAGNPAPCPCWIRRRRRGGGSYSYAVRRHHLLQPPPRLGPLLGDEGEEHRVSKRAVLVHHVATENPLLAGADPPDRRARAFVERAGLELDADAPPHLE